MINTGVSERVIDKDISEKMLPKIQTKAITLLMINIKEML